VPLHSNFFHASNAGSQYDLRKIFDGTLAKHRPGDAVTYVDNHEFVSRSSFLAIVVVSYAMTSLSFHSTAL
jgi:hypothetical protein